MKALQFFFSLLLIPVTIGFALLSITALFAPRIDPNICWFPAFMGLLLPMLLGIDFFLFFFWVIKRSPWAIVPLVAIVLNFNYFLSIFQFNGSSPEPSRSGQEIKIASYNIKRFEDAQAGSIMNSLKEEAVDIVCFQEYMDNAKITPDSVSRLLGLPYHATTYLSQVFYGNFGLGIYSKYPIVAFQKIPLSSLTNDAMWADIKIGEDTVRIFSTHMQTTNVSRKQRELLQQLKGGNIKEQESIIYDMVSGLKENFKIRADQAKQIRQIMDTTRYPIIVCGDFNDTPASFTYQHMKGDMTDGFRDKGHGYGYTFQGLKKLLRIDFLFYSDQFEGVSYESPAWSWSDHKPVIMQLKIQS